MTRIVFLLEEPSMAEFLKGVLPRFFPNLSYLCIVHEGKSDLRRSIPRKLRAWREPGVQFLVLTDNDGADCRSLKSDLLELCRSAGQPDAIVRIVCQELEAWYIGDATALATAFESNELLQMPRRAKYRAPDAVPKPSAELSRLIPRFQKISGAKTVAKHLDRHRNRSPSFHVFLAGVEKLQARIA